MREATYSLPRLGKVKKMIVHVRLFAEYRDLSPSPDGTLVVDMPMGATVGEVLAHLKIPLDKPKILLANGVHVEQAQELREGDVLSIFPPVAGG
jgi:molybdopterin converting factor small subunit